MSRSKPTITEKNDVGSGTCLHMEHNAYGKISLYKTNSTGTELFGSNLTHGHYITVEIHKASMTRRYGTDYVDEGQLVTRFSMSEGQWAQFVSSMGCGSGTPITFGIVPAKGYVLENVDDIINESIRNNFEKDVRRDMEKMLKTGNDALESLRNLQSQKTISKKDLNEAIALMNKHLMNLPANAEFMHKQFQETMEKTVQAGKIEIETFVQNLAVRTGLDVLKAQQAPQLVKESDIVEQNKLQ